MTLRKTLGAAGVVIGLTLGGAGIGMALVDDPVEEGHIAAVEGYLDDAEAAITAARGEVSALRAYRESQNTTTTTAPVTTTTTAPTTTTTSSEWPVLTGVTATGVEGGVRLSWTAPTDPRVTGIQITAGNAGGYLGRRQVAADVTEYTWTGLTVTETTFDLGTIVDGVNPAPTRPPLVRVTATPLPSSTAEPVFPVGGTREAKRQWAIAKEAWVQDVSGGCEPGEPVCATVNASGGAPAGTSWSASWNGLLVTSPIDLRNVDVQGQIVIAASAGNAVQLHNVKARGLWSNGGYVSLAEDVTMVFNPNLAIGQGALNAMSSGFTVRRADLSGFADGMQVSGGGRIEQSWVHDLVYTATSHNDFVQSYSGNTIIDDSVMTGRPPSNNKQNGVFSSNNASASYQVTESVLWTRGAYRANNWTEHANTSTITNTRSWVEGTTVGSVTNDAETVRLLVTEPEGW